MITGPQFEISKVYTLGLQRYKSTETFFVIFLPFAPLRVLLNVFIKARSRFNQSKHIQEVISSSFPSNNRVVFRLIIKEFSI